jgi:uncharacterized protein YgiM (DUF1202 family)
MKRFFWLTFIIFLISITYFSTGLAQSTPTSTTEVSTTVTVLRNANLRAGPGTTFAIVGSARAGDRLTVVGQNATGNWYQLDTGAWISESLVQPVTVVSTTSVTPPAGQQLAVANRSANLRAGPGTNYSVVGAVVAGAQLNLNGRTAAGNWLRLETGEWISASLVNNVQTSLPIVDGATLPATPTASTLPSPTPTPAPPAPTNNSCHPSYDPCVPIASDVDCAGGSGNGPVYVRGPIRVIGPDVYGLDRDGDGIGCER